MNYLYLFMIPEWIFSSRELFKAAYALIILLSCFMIAIKSDRLFKLSDHQGLRYFRNAFLFYGLSFAVKFILGGIANPVGNIAGNQIFFAITNYLFNFLTIMAGFFLLYSLIWKYIEKEKNYHSLLNVRVGILFIVSIAIVSLGPLLKIDYLVHYSQLVLFFIMLIISFNNYVKDKGEHLFLKYYFFTMILGLTTWIFRFFAATYAYAYLTNLLFFMVFLFMISKITKRNYG